MANLADKGPAGATCGVTSSKVNALAGASGHAATAALAARVSWRDLLVTNTDGCLSGWWPLSAVMICGPACGTISHELWRYECCD